MSHQKLVNGPVYPDWFIAAETEGDPDGCAEKMVSSLTLVLSDWEARQVLVSRLDYAIAYYKRSASAVTWNSVFAVMRAMQIIKNMPSDEREALSEYRSEIS